MPPIKMEAQDVRAAARSAVPPAPEVAADCRPLLLLGAAAFRSADGLTLRFQGKTQRLTGVGLYDLLQGLLPSLNGVRTVGEICADLEPQRARRAQRLIRGLLGAGAVVDCARADADEDADVLAEFSGQIGYLRHFLPQPVAAFREFRRSRILLTGSGSGVAVLASSLLRNGLETVRIDSELLRDGTHLAGLESGPEPEPEPEPEPGPGPGPRGRGSVQGMSLRALGGAAEQRPSALCYISDAPCLSTARALSERCLESGISFVPAMLFAGKAYVGPVLRARGDPCWLCFVLRVTATLPADAQASIWQHLALRRRWQDDRASMGATSLGILGNLAGFELFKLFTGCPELEARENVLSVDLSSLQSEVAGVLPHPLCPVCSKAHPQAGRPRRTDLQPRDHRERLQRLSPLIGPLGVATRFEDDDLPQTPLFRTSVRSVLRRNGEFAAFSGLSLECNAAARVAALMHLARAYSVATLDERMLECGTLGEAQRAAVKVIDSSRLRGWLGGCRDSRDAELAPRMLATSRCTGALCSVPAASVHRTSAYNAQRFERTEAGIGVGFSLHDACADAQSAVVALELLRDLRFCRDEWCEVEPRSAEVASRDIRYMLSALGRLEFPVRVFRSRWYEEGGCVVAFSPALPRERDRVAIGHGSSPQSATHTALRELLGTATGADSARTLEKYLPTELGYELDVFSPEQWCGKRRCTWEEFLEQASSPQRRFADILFADVTPTDLAGAGLVVVKALAVDGDPDAAPSIRAA